MIEGIRLRTLGALGLSGANTTGLKALVSQPKRAVLLVYLTVARPKGLHRRDTLLAYLWPESDQARARHALSQLVYQLRKTLGAQTIISEGDEAMGVDHATVWCDVLAFDDAVAERRWADALDLYHGDFLAGVHVADGAPELEDWIVAERARLRRAAASAAWSLALEEERAENISAAAHWGRRAAALLPDDETAVRKLIGLLARLGDRVAALRVYDEFARRLEQEFAAEPSSELKGMAAELRRTATPDVTAPTPLAPPHVLAPERRVPAVRSFGMVAVVAGVVVLAGLAVGVSRLLATRARPPVLAVGTITDLRHGDSAASAPVATDLLATSLARLPGVQVIATSRLYEVQTQIEAATRTARNVFAAARAAGAKELILGTLHPNARGGVLLDLQRIEIVSGNVRKAYRVEGNDLFAAVDQATAAVAVDLDVPAPEEPVADVTTHSLVAYRFYEAGLRAFYESDAAATRLFKSALDEDSSFAMAAYWVWLTRGDGERSYLERAARLADHTTDRERLLILARLAQARLEPGLQALAETLGVRYPADGDALMVLSSSRSFVGDFLGAAAYLRRVIVSDSLAFTGRSPRCRACDAYRDLITMYVYADSLAAAARVAREWIARQPGSVTAWAALEDIFELTQQDSASLAAYHVLDSLSPRAGSQDGLRARLAMRRGDFAEADLRLRRQMVEQPKADAEWFLAISLRNQGRLREAAHLAVTGTTVLRGILLLERGSPREAAADFEQRARPWDPRQPIVGHQAKNLAFNLTHAATCLAAAGDTGRLAAIADSIDWAGRNSVNARELLLADYVRGLLLAARGEWAPAVAAYRRSIFSWNEGYTRVNYALAQALLHLNRPREAIAALQPAFRGSLEAANLYITRTELHELLAQAFDAAGERDSARVHWSAVATAWQNADPQFRTRWETARQHAR